MPEWVPINWDLMKHPTNWITVLLMVFIFGLAVDLVLRGTVFHSDTTK